MMTKRRAESSSLHEVPHEEKKKRKWGSVRDAGREVEAVHAVTGPLALFPTLIRERRSKRSRCCEDHEEHHQTGTEWCTARNTARNTVRNTVRNTARNTATNGGKTESAAAKLSGASDMASEEIKAETRTKTKSPDDNQDELCAFNSFQFWRTPLPALDLSLLDATSTPVLSEGRSNKDGTEDMET